MPFLDLINRDPVTLSMPAVKKAAGALVGLIYCIAIAASAYVVTNTTGFRIISPMIGAIVLGMIVGNIVPTRAWIRPGLKLAMRPVMQTGIVLLGFQITLGQIAAMGPVVILVVSSTLIVTFAATLKVGKLLGVPRQLTELIAVGTSVCGASAILAANSVTGAEEEDVTYALATVTLFGTISMLIYPFLQPLIGLDPRSYGIWTGATLHEVGQVTAAAFQGGEVAGSYGMVSKLLRVTMLVGVVTFLALRQKLNSADGEKNGRAGFPWYVVLFLGAVSLNSSVEIPNPVLDQLQWTSVSLLSVALASMGLQAKVSSLIVKGIRPMLLGVFSWLLISSVGLIIVLTAVA